MRFGGNERRKTEENAKQIDAVGRKMINNSNYEM